MVPGCKSVPLLVLPIEVAVEVEVVTVKVVQPEVQA